MPTVPTSSHYDPYSLDLSHKLEFWLRRSKSWTITHWFTGTLSIALSALSAADFLPAPWQKIVSVSATITVGFLGFANPERKAARYVRAYVILDPALRDYRSGLMDAKTLTQVHRQAEETLHGTGQNPTPAPFTPPVQNPPIPGSGQPSLPSAALTSTSPISSSSGGAEA